MFSSNFLYSRKGSIQIIYQVMIKKRMACLKQKWIYAMSTCLVIVQPNHLINKTKMAQSRPKPALDVPRYNDQRFLSRVTLVACVVYMRVVFVPHVLSLASVGYNTHQCILDKVATYCIAQSKQLGAFRYNHT